MGFLSVFGDYGQSTEESTGTSKSTYKYQDPLSLPQKVARRQTGQFLSQLLKSRGLDSPSFAMGRDVLSATARSQRAAARGTPDLPAGLFYGQLGAINQGQLAAESQLIGQAEQRALDYILRYMGLGTPVTQVGEETETTGTVKGTSWNVGGKAGLGSGGGGNVES